MHLFYRSLLLLALVSSFCAGSIRAQQRPALGDTVYLPLPPNKVSAASQGPSGVAPQLIGPSPEAASLGKFAQVPVSLYTGTPNISIPLYDVKVGPLLVPIGLSYHAGGIKLEEIPSWVGSGWALDAGGVVTRTVRGKPDDQLTYGFLTYSQGRTVQSILQESDNSRLITFAEIVEGCADVEPDVFSINVAGITAQFMFDWNGAPLVYRTSRKLKIAYQTSTATPTVGQITQWTITDDRGMIYTFRDRETTKEVQAGAIGCQSPKAFTSSWYLSEISDVNGENKILLTYTDYSLDYAWQSGESLRVLIGGSGECGTGSNFSTSGSSRLQVNGKRIQTITTDNGLVSVSFIPDTQVRQDNGKLISNAGYNGEFKALSQVIVSNYLNEEIRTFQLEHDYTTTRLTLRKVRTRNNGQNSAPPYQLDYSGFLPVLIPYMYSQDHWGFNNGITNTRLVPGGLTPAYLGGYVYVDGADRSPNATATAQGMLTRMTYPTGGFVEFDYEAHQYGFINNQAVDVSLTGRAGLSAVMRVGTTGNGPFSTTFSTSVSTEDDPYGNQLIPVRVSVMGLSTDGGSLNTKPYAEILNSEGTVIYQQRIDPNFTDVATYIGIYPGIYSVRVGCSNCNPANQPDDGVTIDISYPYAYTAANGERTRLAGGVRLKNQRIYAGTNDTNPQHFNYTYTMSTDASQSSGVIYEKPRYEYIQAVYCALGQRADQGETSGQFYVRAAQNTLNLALTGGSHVGYREVEVTQGADGSTNGKTNYFYTSPFDFPDGLNYGLPLRPAESYNYKTGLLTKSSEYRFQNNAFSLVRETQTSYAFSETSTQGLRINFEGGFYSTAAMYKFEVGPYSTNLGFAQPVYSTEQMTYDGTSTLTEQRIAYDAALQNVVLQTQTASNNNAEQRITEFYYPQDFSGLIAVAPQMVSRNVVGMPLESITKFTRNGTIQITGGSYQTYSLLNGSLRLMDVRKLRIPLVGGGFSYASSGTVDNRYDTEMSFSQFDSRGNYRQLVRRGGQPTTVLWGYKGQYPIAEIANADYSDVETALNLQALTPGTVGNSDDATTLRTRFGLLRGYLTSALVKSATYRPQIGMNS